MKTTYMKIFLVLITLALWLPFSSNAEQSVSFGKYSIHYTAIETTFLSPKVANDYSIKRSRNRIMLNISVLEKRGKGIQKPIRAAVWATGTNLTGQLKQISIRPINEGEAIYYIGELSVADKETLDFTVKVQPSGERETFTLQFRQQYFTR